MPVKRGRRSVRDELAERVSLGKTSGIPVLDRFHIMQKMNKAIDEVRASEAKLPGRAYRRSDIPTIGVVGPLSGYFSVVMIVGYLNDPRQTEHFNHPQWLWALGPISIFWLTRVWRTAAQGRMHHDPLVFLLRDPVSFGTSVLAFSTILVAQF